MTERYDRQERIKNWNQSKLTNARIAIIGDGHLLDFVSIGLAALGIGEIRIITPAPLDHKSDFLRTLTPNWDYDNNNKAGTLALIADHINPDIQAVNIHTGIINEASTIFFKHPDVLIDVSNDPISKQVCLAYCREKRIPFLSGIADDIKGQCMVVRKKEDTITGEFTAKEQGIIISEILGGFLIGETRKLLMPLDGEKPLENVLKFNLNGKERFA